MFLNGQLEAKCFLTELKTNFICQKEIEELMPATAIENPQHEIWKVVSYKSFEVDHFSLINHMLRVYRLDGSVGDNLNIFSILKDFYSYSFPGFNFTSKYSQAFDFYLDVLQDCFDGPEVEKTVAQISESYQGRTPKYKAIREAKEEVRRVFHIEQKKRPRWIQGPEWPMGKQSPMKFERQEKKGELVKYFFVDVDTGEEKVIEQLY